MVNERIDKSMFLVKTFEKIINDRDIKKSCHKQLKTECIKSIEIINKITKDNSSILPSLRNNIIQNDVQAEDFFLPFELACQSKSFNIIIIALDGIQKLIAYGHLVGDLNIHKNIISNELKNDDVVKPGKNLPNLSIKNGCNNKFIDKIIKLICDCIDSEYVNDDIYLQIIKALLTIMTSINCEIHESSLLLALRTCYNINLISKNLVIQTTAKATLNQMVNVVFTKMETHNSEYCLKHCGLLKLESNINSENSNNEEDNDYRSFIEDEVQKTVLEIMDDIINRIEYADNTINGFHMEELPDDKSDLEILEDQTDLPSGQDLKNGNSTKSPNHRRYSKDEPFKCQTAHVLRRDAFLLFRALCRLALKDVNAPPVIDETGEKGLINRNTKQFRQHEYEHRQSMIRSKITSLQLLLAVIETAGPVFKFQESVFKFGVCYHVVAAFLPNFPILNSPLKTTLATSSTSNLIADINKNGNSLSHNNEEIFEDIKLFEICIKLFFAILKIFKNSMKFQIEVFFKEICLNVLENAYPNDFRLIMLNALHEFSQTPQNIIDLYVNYDCDLTATNIFARLIMSLSKLSTHNSVDQQKLLNLTTSNSNPFSISNLLSMPNDDTIYEALNESFQLRIKSLKCLLNIVWCMNQWCTDLSSLNQDNKPDSHHPAGNVVETAKTIPKAISAYTRSESFDDNVSPVMQESQLLQHPRIGDHPTIYENIKQIKDVLERGIEIFKKNPDKGIDYLQNNTNDIVGHSAQDVAKFLFNENRLDKTAVGTYLGDNNDFHKEVMYAYVDLMNFDGKEFVQALRYFLERFKLPGEAQKVDRLMQKFASRYVETTNSGNGIFQSADSAYVLAFSIIMLTTDLHNPQVKKKMTKAEYIRINKSSNEQKDLPESYLSKIYDEIAENKFSVKSNLNLEDEINKDIKNNELKSAKYAELVKPMFKISWTSTLAAFSVCLQETENTEVINLCLNGMKYAIKIACLFQLELERNAFIQALAHFTLLHLALPPNSKILNSLSNFSSSNSNNTFATSYSSAQKTSLPFKLDTLGGDGAFHFNYARSAVGSVTFEDSNLQNLINSSISSSGSYISSGAGGLPGIAPSINNNVSISSSTFKRGTTKTPAVVSLLKHDTNYMTTLVLPKNLLAINAFISIAESEGNYLGTSWFNFLKCVSQLEMAKIIIPLQQQQPSSPTQDGTSPQNIYPSNRKASLASPQQEKVAIGSGKLHDTEYIHRGDDEFLKTSTVELSEIRSTTNSGNEDTVSILSSVSNITSSNSTVNVLQKQIATRQAVGSGPNSSFSAPATSSSTTDNTKQNLLVRVDKIFANSIELDGEAICHFVRALCKVSSEELQSATNALNILARQDAEKSGKMLKSKKHINSPGSNNLKNKKLNQLSPTNKYLRDSYGSGIRLYTLQKIVEISYYNMSRIRLQWSKIWDILGPHFNKVGCHPNESIAFFALDSLRQLSTKFLEKGELSNFCFQKDFLKPFEYIIKNNKSINVVDMTVRCIDQMIRAQAHNIKSGWKNLFSIFQIVATTVRDQQIYEMAFNSITYIITEISENNENCDFAYNLIDSFQSIIKCLSEFACSADNFETGFEGGEEEKQHPAPLANKTGAHESPSYRTGKTSLSPVFSSVYHSADISMEAIKLIRACAQFVNSHPEAFKEYTYEDIKICEEDFPWVKGWFPILFELSCIINRCSLDIRTRALTVMFDILKSYGNEFSAHWWRDFFRVLFRIFDNYKIPNQSEKSEWMNTTCNHALYAIVDVFSQFYDPLCTTLLQDFYQQLKWCLKQGNEQLARAALNCLENIVMSNGMKFRVKEWDYSCNIIVQMFTETLPNQLLSKSLWLGEPNQNSCNDQDQPTSSNMVHMLEKGSPSDLYQLSNLSTGLTVQCVIQLELIKLLDRLIFYKYPEELLAPMEGSVKNRISKNDNSNVGLTTAAAARPYLPPPFFIYKKPGAASHLRSGNMDTLGDQYHETYSISYRGNAYTDEVINLKDQDEIEDTTITDPITKSRYQVANRYIPDNDIHRLEGNTQHNKKRLLFYECLTSRQLLYLAMDFLLKSHRFAVKFNSDTILREILHRKSFKGRAKPNLIKQETASLDLFLTILFTMFEDDSKQNQCQFVRDKLIMHVIESIKYYIELESKSHRETWTSIIQLILNKLVSLKENKFRLLITSLYPYCCELITHLQENESRSSLQSFFLRMGASTQSSLGMPKLSSGTPIQISNSNLTHRSMEEGEDIENRLKQLELDSEINKPTRLI